MLFTMTRNSRLRTRSTVGAAAMSLLMVATGCGTSDQPRPEDSVAPEPTVTQGGTERSLPKPSAADVSGDPIALMVQMCETVFTRDAGTEERYADSYVRAKELMSPKLAAELLKPVAAERPFPQWVQWQQEKAWIAGECEETTAQHPADTDTSMSRVLQVTEVVERDSDPGQSTTDQSWVVYAAATKGSRGWEVSQFDVRTN